MRPAGCLERVRGQKSLLDGQVEVDGRHISAQWKGKAEIFIAIRNILK